MMTSNSCPISSLSPSAAYYTTPDQNLRAPAAPNPQYDSVSISSPRGDSLFHKNVVSRLSQEVRTATTTGNIQALRQQVAAGEYTPDPMAIAARILFLGEG